MGHDHVFAGVFGEILPGDDDVLDPATLVTLHESLVEELAHPEVAGAWTETWRRIAELAREGSSEAWLGAVAAASELLHLVTGLAGRSILGLLQLADLVRVAWPYLSTLGDRRLTPA